MDLENCVGSLAHGKRSYIMEWRTEIGMGRIEAQEGHRDCCTFDVRECEVLFGHCEEVKGKKWTVTRRNGRGERRAARAFRKGKASPSRAEVGRAVTLFLFALVATNASRNQKGGNDIQLSGNGRVRSTGGTAADSSSFLAGTGCLPIFTCQVSPERPS